MKERKKRETKKVREREREVGQVKHYAKKQQKRQAKLVRGAEIRINSCIRVGASHRPLLIHICQVLGRQ